MTSNPSFSDNSVMRAEKKNHWKQNNAWSLWRKEPEKKGSFFSRPSRGAPTPTFLSLIFFLETSPERRDYTKSIIVRSRKDWSEPTGDRWRVCETLPRSGKRWHSKNGWHGNMKNCYWSCDILNLHISFCRTGGFVTFFKDYFVVNN